MRVVFKKHDSKPDSIKKEDILTGFELRVNDKLENYHIGHSLLLDYEGDVHKYTIIGMVRTKPIDPTSLEGKIFNTIIVYLKEKTKVDIDSTFG
jgi:hypothetical protein